MSSSAFCAPWPQAQGELLVITRTENFNSQEFSQFSTSLYAKYGLTEKVTLGTKVNYATQEYGGTFPASAAGITEADVFGQREVMRRDHTVVSARITYAAPTRLDRQLQAPDVAFTDLEYGDAFELAILTGHSLNQDGTLFVTAETGNRLSLGDDADLLKADFSVGFKPGEKWMLILKSFNTLSLQNQTGTGIDYDVYRVEPAVTYHYKPNTSLSFGGSYDLGGRNLETGSSLFFSIWNRF